MKKEYTEFTTSTGLVAKYKIIGEDLRHDVSIKIVSKIPRSFYYSSLNEAGAWYDENILPKLMKS